MKKLTCEMCGSTDIIKQDGVFVCQVCGCKYSIEEAKKMMVEGTVEVTGTVKVDNSDAIKNYLDMAKNAINAKNMAEAESYCNRIIEMDTNNWEAWYIKGKAAGWQSTLANVRTSETVNAFINAMNHCPEEEKDDLRRTCQNDFQNVQTALILARMKSFESHPSQDDLGNLSNDLQSIVVNSVNLLIKADIPIGENAPYINAINTGLVAAWKNVYSNYIGNDGHPNRYDFERFLEEGNVIIGAYEKTIAFCGDKNDDIEINKLKIQIYKNMVFVQEKLINACSYKVSFDGGIKSYEKEYTLTADARNLRQKMIYDWNNKISNLESSNRRLQDTEYVEEMAKRKAEQEERQKRTNDYWAEHAEEKAALDAEKEELQKQIVQLNARIAELDKGKNEPIAESEKEEQIKLRYTMKALHDEYNHLGLFSGKRKKEIQTQLSEIENKTGKIEKEIAAKVAERDAKIKAETDALREQMKPLYARMAEIDAELTKER